jgi:uncharacterized membrane protein YdfJ with MMPL/SSD domain
MRWLVILGWLALFGVGGWKALDFLASTNDDGNLPDSAPSVIAADTLALFFQDKPIRNYDVNAVILSGDSTVSQAAFDVAVQCVHVELAAALSGVSGVALDDFVLSATTLGNTTAAALFLRPRAALFILQLTLAHENTFDNKLFKPLVAGIRRDCLAGQGGLSLAYTGDPLLWDSIANSMEGDIILSDAIAIPLSLFVVCLTLRSFRLVIIPILSIAGAVFPFQCFVRTSLAIDAGRLSTGGIFVSFLIMLQVSHKIHVASFAPNLMMAIGVAMSVDYSLFCLSRYREAMRAGADNTEAVVATLWSAGKVTAVVSHFWQRLTRRCFEDDHRVRGYFGLLFSAALVCASGAAA